MPAPRTVSRFRRPRPVVRLTRLRAVLAAVAALCVLALVTWVVFFSSLLAADKVAVAGATTIPDREVETAAGVPVGTPLARVDLDAIRASVARLPAVKTVAVRRSWPHTIAIAITERQPVATVYRGGRWEILDSSGVVFRTSASRPDALPVVAVSRSAPEDLLPPVAAVAAALPPDLVAQTRRITAQTMDSITLRLTNGADVLWGGAAESYRKVEVLKALLVHGKASSYDVSVPGQPTTGR